MVADLEVSVAGAMPNNSMQRTALRAAADAERWADKYEVKIWKLQLL